tara:strand:+ start:4597 stop:6573 length:1977 start_codon:yes stop_codon:yes gene_type:complete
MATYYKYQPRDPQAAINWAEVTTQLSDVVQDEIQTRIDKKGAINEATRQFQKTLDVIPQGESDTIRNWGIAYADNAREVTLVQDKLLRAGGIDQYEYTQMRQNLLDGTENAFNLIEDYQAQYATKMERFKSQDPATASQKMEVWLMENAEGFANFNRSELVINPQTGKVSAGYREKNKDTGLTTISSNPNDLVAVSALRGQITGTFDKYNVEAATSKWVEATGAWTEIAKVTGGRTSAGQLITSIDPFSKKLSKSDMENLGLTTEEGEVANLYLSAENDWIKGQLSGNGYNISSVLTDFVVADKDNKEYSFTFDVEEAKKDKSLILMSREGGTVVPVFDESINPNSKQQEDEVYAYMRTAIRNKVNREKKAVSVNDYKSPTTNDTNNANKVGGEKSSLSNVAKLYYGNAAEVDEAIDFLRSSNPAIDTIDRNAKSVIITYTDGRQPEELDFADNTNTGLTQDAWVTGAANFFATKKIDNIDTLLKSSSTNPQRSFNAESKGFGASNQKIDETQEDTFLREMDKFISVDSFVKDDENNFDETLTETAIKSALKSIPGGNKLVVGTAKAGSDIVTVKDGNVEIARINMEGTEDEISAQIIKGLDDIKRASWSLATKEDIKTSGLGFFLVGKGTSKEVKRTSKRQETNKKLNVDAFGNPIN